MKGMKKIQTATGSEKNVISLFSGAMGLDLGLRSAGFDTRSVLEVNKAAVDTIRLNASHLTELSEEAILHTSVSDITAGEILKAAGLRREEVTLMSAGPCCQSFSTAGKRGSMSDPRGGLFFEFCRILQEVRPRFFVMENVRGVLSAAVKHRTLNERGPGHKPLAQEETFGSALKLILQELKSLDYYVTFGILNSADFGVPQKRWRVFFIGSRDGEEISLPKPTHAAPEQASELGLEPWVTLRQTIEHVESSRWNPFAESRLKLLKKLGPGENWRDLPERLHRDALGAALDSWGGRSGFCRRLAWDEPAPTLTTAPDGRATTLCHPTEDRPLSLEEYAVLQQFPSWWKFSGSISQQYTQIGNAVPLGFGEAIGKSLLATMERTRLEGLPTDHRQRAGKIVCADKVVEKAVRNKKKTQLHPPHLRKNSDLAAAKKWLLTAGTEPGKAKAPRKSTATRSR